MAGAFIGLYLILYTRRKWLWSGIFSIVAGLFAYLTWCIPENCMDIIILIKMFINNNCLISLCLLLFNFSAIITFGSVTNDS